MRFSLRFWPTCVQWVRSTTCTGTPDLRDWVRGRHRLHPSNRLRHYRPRWGEVVRGLRTFHGYHSHGFPNCFFIGATQTGLTPNYPHTLSEQTGHVPHIIAGCMENDEVTVEAARRAEPTVLLRTVPPATTTVRERRAIASPSSPDSSGEPRNRSLS